MESPNDSIQTEKRKLGLYERPWLSLLAIIVTTVLLSVVTGIVVFSLTRLPLDSSAFQIVTAISYNILTVFLIAPFVLHLPKGKRTFRQFLEDIGLTRVRPLFRLVLLGLSCYSILALSQITASFVYRFFEELPLDWSFVQQVFDPTMDLPPTSPSLLLSIPSIFEEMAFRGIVLTVFLRKYSERESIIYSSIGFASIHLFSAVLGGDPLWALGMAVWASIIGLFYGYVFVRTRSLLPPMIVHYLGNAFVSTLVGYIQARASFEVQFLYGIIFTLGVVPTTLMILWARFFTSRWLPSNNVQDTNESATA